MLGPLPALIYRKGYRSNLFCKSPRNFSSLKRPIMSPLYFDVKEHVLPGQYIREYPGATWDDQEAILHLHIKQYQPKDQLHAEPGAVTIIGAHANGFPKVCRIVASSQATSSYDR